MKFTKMHGIGNDYVYVNCFEETVEHPSQVAKKVSDRHFGIGSDGLILIHPSDVADCRMQMFNADGSEGRMCGNGIRCVGKYVYDHKIVEKTTITVETQSGIKTLNLSVLEGEVVELMVDMGEPRMTSLIPESIVVNGIEQEYIGVEVGSPHAVYVVPDVSALDLERIGPSYEHHIRFPDRINTEYIQIIDRTHIKMRVWERGSGETLACGTGACACAVAAMLLGAVEREVKIELLGGTLTIRWDELNNHVFMSGPAVEVYHGEIV